MADVRHPRLPMIRCCATHDDARRAAPTGHQFPQPGLLERRAPVTISFTSPKLTRKPPHPGAPPEVTVRDHRPSPGGPQVIQAALTATIQCSASAWHSRSASVGPVLLSLT